MMVCACKSIAGTRPVAMMVSSRGPALFSIPRPSKKPAANCFGVRVPTTCPCARQLPKLRVTCFTRLRIICESRREPRRRRRDTRCEAIAQTGQSMERINSMSKYAWVLALSVTLITVATSAVRAADQPAAAATWYLAQLNFDDPSAIPAISDYKGTFDSIVAGAFANPAACETVKAQF